MKDFGGKWTIQKIEIFVKYAKAYLQIMKKHPYWKIMYFDGFAGSGEIEKNGNSYNTLIEGVAQRMLSIEDPRPFDMLYFVEKDANKAKRLKYLIEEQFPDKLNITHIVTEDFNKKLHDLANFLQHPNNKNYKVLAFVDPYGMQVEWDSLLALKNLSIDMWILVPTGIGVVRLLKRDGKISNAWLDKLKIFLGLDEHEINDYFYKTETVNTLFGKETIKKKEENAISKAAELYKSRLNEIFKHVSEPFIMKNTKGSTMFHFYMASNNSTAQKIANDIVKPQLKH